MKVLDAFSWLPAKEISIKELEQIFIEHLNGIYEGEYKVLLECPLTGFNEDDWYSLVEYATVYGKGDIRFTFKNGMEIKA